MTAPTTFHLIRHATYGLIGHTLAGRTPGHALNEAGRAQAAALAASLAGRPIAAVVSSPLERARETAAPIAAGHGLAVSVDGDFNEIDFGEWTGLAFDTLH
ncbi:MAG: histidine phosphatase family protein, partial [Acidisphaera sp.]|nr:histidine phosphatase family protein [Acidisphaera sp.]